MVARGLRITCSFQHNALRRCASGAGIVVQVPPAPPAGSISPTAATQPASRGAGIPPCALPGDPSDGVRERSTDCSRSSLAPLTCGDRGEADAEAGAEATAVQLGLHCGGGEGRGLGAGGGGIAAASAAAACATEPCWVGISASIGAG